MHLRIGALGVLLPAPSSAYLGCALDVAISLAALWSLFKSKLPPPSVGLPTQVVAASAFCALLLSLEYGEMSSRRALALVATFSLAMQLVARRAAGGVDAWLHLARALALAYFGSPLSATGTAASIGVHVVAALFLFEKRYRQPIRAHARGLLMLKGFSLAMLHHKRGLVADDLGDKPGEEAYYESCRRLEFNPKERMFVVRAILRAEWKVLTAVFVASTLNRVAADGRRLVFVAILAALGGERPTTAADLAMLYGIWQLLALTTPVGEYIKGVEGGVEARIASVISTEILKVNIASRVSVYSTRALSLTVKAYADGVSCLVEAASSALSQVVNVWIVANRVGWWFLLPAVIVLAHEALSLVVSTKVKRLEERHERETQPEFTKDFYAMASNMRAIKFYAWEEAFRGVVDYLDVEWVPPAVWRISQHLINMIGSATSQIASAVTITSYISSTSGVTYPDVALLMGSIDSLAAFTTTASGIARTCIDMERGARFIRELVAPSDKCYIQREPAASGSPVELEDCTFSWGADKFTLPRISLTVAAGEFVAVVGRVGSGKSSLASALCGEMPLVGGRGRVCGSIGYVSQKPRVMDGTFRENMLMGEDYDEKLFQRIIHACALTYDLEQMESGDLTPIGENGLKLSGGQVVRLALARALYRQADVYVFDDLLAAVDSRVERHLVEHVLCAEGIIGTKTRILITHAMHVVPLSDRVVTFSKGCADVATQSPAPLAIVLADGPSPHDAELGENAAEAAAEAPLTEVDLDIESPPVHWSHIGRYLRLSGYWAIAAVAACKIASVCVAFYADTLRIGLMVDSNPATMAQSLQRYLALNALIQIGRQQLRVFEMWLRRTVWLKPLAETTRQLSLDLQLSMRLQWYERLSTTVIVRMFLFYRAAMMRDLPDTLCDGAIGGGLTALSSVAQVVTVAPRALWILVPLSGMVYVAHRCATTVSRAIEQHKHKARSARTKGAREILFHKAFHRIHGSSAGMIRKMQALEAKMVCLSGAHNAVERARSLTDALLREIVQSATLLFGLQQHLFWGHSISAGNVDAETTLLLGVLSQLSGVAAATHAAEDELPNLARYFHTIDTLPREPPSIVAGSRPRSSWPESGQIEFQAYNMRYQDDMDLVLKDLSFSIGAKEKIGIVGRTGAGKSSLTHALMRMVEPDSGRVLIDGVDTATIGVHDLRSHIGVIPQNPALFSGTIRDNLDPMHQYTDAEIWRALRAAKIDHLVAKPSGTYVEQPDYDLFDEDKGKWIEGVGLDKWVCWGGSNFSVGQRQLVSICRALLWQRRILVLDEATANIDGETDQVIQGVLRSEFEDCTVLTIAHRLDTVMDCDRILVMDQGRAVEFDSPANLLARDSQFAQLVECMRVSQGH